MGKKMSETTNASMPRDCGMTRRELMSHCFRCGFDYCYYGTNDGGGVPPIRPLPEALERALQGAGLGGYLYEEKQNELP